MGSWEERCRGFRPYAPGISHFLGQYLAFLTFGTAWEICQWTSIVLRTLVGSRSTSNMPSDLATGQIDTGGCRNASSAWPNAQASHPAHSFCVASSFQTTRFGTIHLLGADAPAPSSLCRQLIRNATLSTSLVLLDHPMGGYDGSIDIAWVTPEEPVVVASPEPLDRVETWHS
jgi:hypothetical protein